jgi:predicted RecA/RadA family phage recombinase
MKNFVSAGRTVDLTAPTGGVVSGLGYKIGGLIVIAGNTVAEGSPFPACLEGLFDVLAEGSGSGQAWAEGDAIYWDNTNHQFTKTAASNTLAGFACGAKLTADVLGRLKLTPGVGAALALALAADS